MTLDEPLALSDAVRLARSIVLSGSVLFRKHCRDQMGARGIDANDCINTVRGGQCELFDFRAGTYRYQICTNRFGVAVAFYDETEMVFVTCWRKK